MGWRGCGDADVLTACSSASLDGWNAKRARIALILRKGHTPATAMRWWSSFDFSKVIDMDKSKAISSVSERVGVIADDPHLLQVGGARNPLVTAARNIRAELKRAGIPAYVRCNRHAGGESIYVQVAERLNDVKAICDKYIDTEFDGMNDISCYRPTPWTTCFGSATHVSAQIAWGGAALAKLEKRALKASVALKPKRTGAARRAM